MRKHLRLAFEPLNSEVEFLSLKYESLQMTNDK